MFAAQLMNCWVVKQKVLSCSLACSMFPNPRYLILCIQKLLCGASLWFVFVLWFVLVVCAVVVSSAGASIQFCAWRCVPCLLRACPVARYQKSASRGLCCVFPGPPKPALVVVCCFGAACWFWRWGAAFPCPMPPQTLAVCRCAFFINVFRRAPSSLLGQPFPGLPFLRTVMACSASRVNTT